VTKLNVIECSRAPGQYGILAIPTLIIFTDGKEAGRAVGTFPKHVPKGKLEAVLWPQSKEGT